MADQEFRARILTEADLAAVDETIDAYGQLEAATESAAAAFSAIESASGDSDAGLKAVSAGGYEAADALSSAAETASAFSSDLSSTADAADMAGRAAQDASSAFVKMGDSAERADIGTRSLTESSVELDKFARAATGGVNGLLGLLVDLGPAGIAAAAGIGTLVSQGSDWIVVAGEQELSETRLAGAMRANIDNFEQYTDRVNAAVLAGRQIAQDDDAVRGALTNLFRITKDADESFRLLAVSEDIAAGSGDNLASVARNLARAVETGSGRTLRQYGIIVKEGATATDILTAASQQYEGAARDVGNTAAAAGKRATDAWNDFKETIGTAFLPMVAAAGNELSVMTDETTASADGANNLSNALNVVATTVSGPVMDALSNLEDAVTILNFLFPSTSAAAQQSADDMQSAAEQAAAAYAATLPEGVREGAVEAIAEMQRTADAAHDAADEMGSAGTEGGEYWGDGLVGGMQAAQPGYLGELNNVVNLMNQVTGKAKPAGSNTGSGYVNALASAISAGNPNAVAAVNDIIKVFNKGVKAVNVMRGLLGQSLIPEAQLATGNVRSYDSIEDARSVGMAGGVGGPGGAVGDAGYERNLKKLRDEYIAKYGEDPDTGEALDPLTGRKPSTNKGGGKKGASTKSTSDAVKRAADQQAAAQKAYDDAKRRYDLFVKQKALEDQIDQAQDALNAKQEEAQGVQDAYAESIESTNRNIKEQEDAERNAVAPIQARADAMESAYQDMKRTNEDALHAIDVSIHNTEDVLTELEREAEDALKPLQENADAARAAIDDLNREAASVRETFQDTRDALDDQIAGIDAAQKAAFAGPLQQVQVLEDALYDLGLREKAEMAGWDSRIEAKTKALKAEQKAVDDLAASYDTRLLEAEKELDALDRTERAEDRAKQFAEQEQSITNLQARLRGLTQGSLEYNQVQKQIEEETAQLGQDRQRATIEDRIQALEDEKEQQVSAAQERLEQHQQELQLLQEQRDARAEAFQQQREQLEAEREQLNRRMELEQRVYDQQRELVQQQIDAVTREQELYDRQLRDRQAAAEETARQADAAVVAEQERQNQRQESTRQELERLQNERREVAFNSSERERLALRDIDIMKNFVEQTKAPYETEIDRLKNIQQGYKDRATEADKAYDAEIEGLRDNVEAARGVLDEFRDTEASANAVRNLAEAQGKYAEATQKIADLKTPLSDTATNIGTVKDNMAALGNTLKDNTVPGMQGLSTSMGTELAAQEARWLATYGLPAGGQTPGKIPDLLNHRNTQGLYAFLQTSADLGLGVDGLRGVFNNRFDDIDTDVNSKATNIGYSFLDGMKAGLEDPARNTALQGAIAKVVSDAIDAAKRAAGIASPSSVMADQVGEELINGGILGAERRADAFASTMSGIMQRGIDSVAYTRGGLGAFGIAGGFTGPLIENLTIPITTTSLPTTPAGFRDSAEAMAVALRDEFVRLGFDVGRRA